MSWFDFPNVQKYDQDVGWLIEEWKKLDAQVKNLLACCDTVEEQIKTLQDWVNNFDNSYIEEVVSKFLMTAIFVSISDAGYIVYHIPKSWSEITFRTTGLDISLPIQPEYGHLVLVY